MQSTETDPKMTQMVGFIRKGFKTTISMLEDIKDTMVTGNEQTGNLGRATETIEKNQVQTLELKNIISETKKNVGWV